MTSPTKRATCITITATLVFGGCSLTPPPRSPEDERTLQRARSQQREATVAKEQLKQEYAEVSAKIQKKQAEIAAIDEPQKRAEQEYNEQKLAYTSYRDRVEAAEEYVVNCDSATGDPKAGIETGVLIAASLAEFVSEPNRDEALKGMDKCRQRLVKEWRVQMNENIRDLQKEFAIAIEDNFDTNNPYSRGDLTAKVKGTKLAVRMRGNFEGRARHSQDQVDMWCERASGLYTEISLANSHGKFSCRPTDGPKDMIAEILEEAQASSSWSVEGKQATPTMPAPPPPMGEGPSEHRAQLLADVQQLEKRLEEIKSQGSEVVDRNAQAQRTVDGVALRHKSQQADWKKTQIKRASNTQIAGGVLAGLGGAFLLGNIAAWQGGVAGAQDFLPISAAISVPVLVTGIVLVVAGGIRKSRLQQVSVR